MTFASQEESVSSSSTIELYRFAIGPFTWNYNSSETDFTVESVVYVATQISRTNIRQSQDITRAPITITVPFDDSFVQQYIEAPPSQEATVRVSSLHETDSLDEVVIDWVGRVAGVKFVQENYAEIRCEPLTTTLRRTLLRRNYQRQCPHLLYSQQCLVNRTEFDAETTLAVVEGVTLTADIASTQVDGYWIGGFVQFTHATIPIQRRFINGHVGNVITMDLPITDRPAGTLVTIFAGCDHTLTTCRDKFANLDNFGGMPYIPAKNPMNGTSIF